MPGVMGGLILGWICSSIREIHQFLNCLTGFKTLNMGRGVLDVFFQCLHFPPSMLIQADPGWWLTTFQVDLRHEIDFYLLLFCICRLLCFTTVHKNLLSISHRSRLISATRSTFTNRSVQCPDTSQQLQHPPLTGVIWYVNKPLNII